MTDTAQFETKPELTALVRSYKNPDYALIADGVLPEQTVSDRKFGYTAYPEDQNFNVPDTHIGPRSAANLLEITGSEETAKVVDYGLAIPLDNPTIQAAEKAGYDPRKQAANLSMGIVTLDREVRVAKFINDPTNYGTGLTTALSGTSQFSDYANSTPYDVIEDYLDKCLIRPNQLVIGHNAWKKLKRHPQIVEYVKGDSNASGVVSKEAVAELFEVQRVYVGASRININRPGQAMELNRVWDNLVAGHFIDSSATPEIGGVTYGFTARHGQKVAGTKQVDMGLHGGELVRAGESLKEVPVAPDAGFLIQAAVPAQA